jgi:predicted transport protein
MKSSPDPGRGEGSGVTWVCPRCQRTFASEGQFRSHDVTGLDPHFAGRPAELRTAFDTLVAALPADVHIDALKTAIILAARTTFAYVVVQRDRLSIGVFLDRALVSPRVTKIDHVSSGKVANVVDVREPGEIDGELRSWLSEAYDLRSAPPRERQGRRPASRPADIE